MTIAQLELAVGPNLTAEQQRLNLAVAELFKQKGVRDVPGHPYAYQEFVHFDDEEHRTGEVLRLVYVALTNGGIKPEGEAFPAVEPSSEMAIFGYVTQLDKYIGGCKNVRWRHRPEISLDTEHPGKWVVYSRLVVHT